MNLTTDVLWDYLLPVDPDAKVYNCIKRKTSFNSVRQHPNKDHVFVENAIYVVDYEKYDVINSQQERFSENTFIFVNEDNDKTFDPKNCYINCFVIMNDSIMDIFTQVSDIAVDFNSWAERLNDALINNLPLEDLIAIGQEYIINPFIVLDEALNVIAHTDNIKEDDETFRETIEKGYTPPTLIAEIIRKRGAAKKSFETYESYSDEAITPFEEVNQPVLVDGKIAAVIYVHCNQVTPSEGSADVLKYFASKLSHYFKRNVVESVRYTGDSAKSGKMLSYILRHNLDEQEIQLMAEAADFPVHAKFNMYVLEPKTMVGQKYLLNRVLENLPLERCFVAEEKIVVVSALIRKNSSAEEHIENLNKSILRIMEENNCYCGKAREFNSLIVCKDAFVQACAALRIGKKLINNSHSVNDFDWKVKKDSQIFRYEDIVLHHMLESCSKELNLKSICSPAVLEMLEHDRLKGTDNYKVLYTYLENDRVTSDAANLLHMHRNNVNYRIKRIEETFGIDLSDIEERLRIQMSFRILDMLEE